MLCSWKHVLILGLLTFPKLKGLKRAHGMWIDVSSGQSRVPLPLGVHRLEGRREILRGKEGEVDLFHLLNMVREQSAGRTFTNTSCRVYVNLGYVPITGADCA